jgi:hypothetical protein
MDADRRIRAAIEEHWRASESGDTNAEHAMYAEDAVLDYPRSGERFRGRTTISAQRGGHPADRHFADEHVRHETQPVYSVSSRRSSPGASIRFTMALRNPNCLARK